MGLEGRGGGMKLASTYILKVRAILVYCDYTINKPLMSNNNKLVYSLKLTTVTLFPE